MNTLQSISLAVERSASVSEVAVGAGLVAETGAIFRRHFGDSEACLLADEEAWAAAGPAVEQSLAGAGIRTRKHILAATPRPKPTVQLANTLRDVLAEDESIPVAVGSGVMNDLVKHAAFSLQRRYLCVATAASMDGYTSAGAPLSDDGFKMTIACRPALAVVGDLDIIADAPSQMTGWGYGDLAGKIPAGADWIVADALGIEALDRVAWPMVQTDLRAWLSGAERIASGDRSAIEGLFAGLVLVGLAMEAHGSSRPASGADHQIAHLWEMDGLEHGGERVSHGACVGVGCVVALQLYDWVLGQDFSGLDVESVVAKAPSLETKAGMIASAFKGGEVAARALTETTAKHLEPHDHRIRLKSLQDVWPDLRARLSEHLMKPDEMKRHLKAAGAPSNPSQIGVDAGYLYRTALNARFLRSRYTILDFLDETGCLERALQAALSKSAIAGA